jgi:hypothetical protein
MERPDRSLQNAAKNANTTAGQVGGQYGGEAQSIGANLIPQLQAEATGNVGLTPTQANNEFVAAQQGAGGATAGVAGAAGLNAGRTRNSAALSGILDQASRNRAMAGSQAGLNIQNQSAEIARQNQARAQNALQGFYGTDVTAQMRAMGLQPEDINAAVNAGKSGWFQNSIDLLDALNKGAQTGNAIANG